MHDTLLETRALELKNLILDPGFPDKEGFTALDFRIAKNKKFKAGSKEQEEEQDIAISLFSELPEFKPEEISQFISYVNRSKFDTGEIVDQLLSFLSFGAGRDLKVFQKAELVKFLVSKKPELVDTELINTDLAELQISEPWLFVSLLSEKSKEAAMELIKYLIADNRFDKTAFLNVFIKWLGTSDTTFLQKVYKELLPLVDDQNFNDLMKAKLGTDAIKEINSQKEVIVKIVGQLSQVKNPGLIAKAEIYKVVKSREANHPKTKISRGQALARKGRGATYRLKRRFVKQVNDYESETVQIILDAVAPATRTHSPGSKPSLVNSRVYSDFKSSVNRHLRNG